MLLAVIQTKIHLTTIQEIQAHRPIQKRTITRTTAKTKAVTASKVISGTSKEVMQMIEYQNQVLDREPEENETFGVGDAMPIYFF